MASVWEAPRAIQDAVKRLKRNHHPHLEHASIWVLCSDRAPLRKNRFVPTSSTLCTKTEKLSAGHDFKITISMEAWGKLTDEQRDRALDEALYRCGVKFEPETLEINGKAHVVKDDLGRVIFTDEVAYDKEGRPRWQINPPDADVFFGMLQRYGAYNDEADNTIRTVQGKPLLQQVAASGPVDDVD
ncbi:MAG: hypothetical protein GC159_05115 [Phycisphaera sp.]|nr:hypothetical protein [Phycisphaera sp.]